MQWNGFETFYQLLSHRVKNDLFEQTSSGIKESIFSCPVFVGKFLLVWVAGGDTTEGAHSHLYLCLYLHLYLHLLVHKCPVDQAVSGWWRHKWGARPFVLKRGKPLPLLLSLLAQACPSLPKLAQQPKEAKMQEVKQAAIAFTQSDTVFVTILQLSIFHTIATKVLQKPVKSNWISCFSLITCIWNCLSSHFGFANWPGLWATSSLQWLKSSDPKTSRLRLNEAG